MTLVKDDLRAAAEALGPWHHRLELADGLWTSDVQGADATGTVPTLNDVERAFDLQVGDVFPDGLQGRSFLDCACNAGGYSFVAKDRGAGRVLGFDVRQHWIDQAEFIRTHRTADSSDMEFRVADLLEIGDLGEDFDVTWFSGIFYHLPDPVASLKLVADRTREVLLLNTMVDWLEPGQEEVPGLLMKREGTEELMSGVHHMAWVPTGPKVLRQLLAWLGFPETRIVMWNQIEAEGILRGVTRTVRHGRIAIVAAREPGRLEGVRNLSEPKMRERRHEIAR